MTPVRAIRQEKQIKSTEIRKEEIKSFLFVDNMILHIDIFNTPQKKNKHLLQQTQHRVRKQSQDSYDLRVPLYCLTAYLGPQSLQVTSSMMGSAAL